jgi:predicted GNAT family acetyltransferase
MLALANLTKPGPFFERTHRLGDFIGVKVPDGKGGRRLAAMAGERMRLPGFTEVSGICTHPDYRGHGYAGGLSRIAYAHNTAATGLYETLGFSLRRQMHMRVLTRA